MVNTRGEHATAVLADEGMGGAGWGKGRDGGGGDMNQIGPDQTWLDMVAKQNLP